MARYPETIPAPVSQQRVHIDSGLAKPGDRATRSRTAGLAEKWACFRSAALRRCEDRGEKRRFHSRGPSSLSWQHVAARDDLQAHLKLIKKGGERMRRLRLESELRVSWQLVSAELNMYSVSSYVEEKVLSLTSEGD